MKTIAKLGLALALVVGLVAAATAGDEMTLTGKIMCAKCTLKKADAKECQDVLVVKDGDKTAEYYVEKNEVAKKFGHVCTGDKPAEVTGKVTEKDGKKWISATKMDEKKS
jgi:type 1 fimbria pilin